MLLPLPTGWRYPQPRLGTPRKVLSPSRDAVLRGPVGNRVTGEIRFENQILATLSAVITSSDAKG